jgi:regulator of RNase E activity RraA
MRGVAGLIADGPVRDIDEARAYGFPIYAQHLTAKTARGRVVELGADVPVVFHGVRVNPGDYVIADSSAVVIIAAPEISKVLAIAEEIAAKEALMAKALMAGVSITAVMGGDYEHMLSK